MKSRFILLLSFALISGARLFGQASPLRHSSESVAFTWGIHATTAAGYTFNIYDGVNQIYTSGPQGAAGLSTWTTAALSLVMVPGKVYLFQIISADWNEAEVRFNTPPGYQLVVNGTARDMYLARPIRDPSSGVLLSNAYGAFITLLPKDGSLGLAYGQASPPGVAGSLLWSVGLGTNFTGMASGTLSISENNISGALDAASLNCNELSTDVVVTRDSGTQVITQVDTPQGTVNVGNQQYDGSGNPTGFDISYGSDPVYQIRKASSTSLTITKVSGGGSQVTTISQSGTDWSRSDDSSRTFTFHTTGTTSGVRSETVTITDSGSAVVSNETRTYQTILGREELMSRTCDPAGRALVTQYAYYTDTDPYSGRAGKLQSVTNPDGSWVMYEYYDSLSTDYAKWGRLKAVYTPWQDGPSAPPTTSTAKALSHAVYYDYAAAYSLYACELASVTEQAPNAGGTARTIKSTQISTSMWQNIPYYDAPRPNIMPYRTDTIQSYSASGTALTTVKKSYAALADSRWAGRPITQLNPDGSQMSGIYGNGTPSTSFLFSGTGVGTYWGQYMYNGWHTAVTTDAVLLSSVATDISGVNFGLDPIYLVPNRSTRSWQYYQPRTEGQYSIEKTTQVFKGGDPTLDGSWETITTEGQLYLGSDLVGVDHVNGDMESYQWSGGLKIAESDFAGTGTTYSYDNLNRQVLANRAGISASGSYPAQGNIYTHTAYDAANHVTSTKVSTSSNPAAAGITTSHTYDLAGLLTSDTDPDGLVTSYTYSSDLLTVTATLPGGATKITQKYRDGTPKSTTGTAQVNEFYTTTVNSDGTLTQRKTVGSSSGSSRWSQTTTDWLGRTVKVEKPAPGSTTFTQQSYYNSSGQLVKKTETGLADTLSEYNAMGDLFRTGLDLNANGALDPASNDRITETTTTLSFESSYWWNVTTTLAYNVASSGTPITKGISKQRVSGFSGTGTSGVHSDTISIDVFGNQTHATRAIDWFAHLVTDTTDVPDSSTDVVKVTRNGLLQSSQSAQGLTSYTYYDALGHVTKQTDPRTDSSSTARIAYAANSNRVTSKQDTAGNTTSYTYDSAGRVFSTTDPLGKVTYQSYNARGQTTRIWGANTYPVEYAFNDFGEQTTISTFRDGTGWDASTWPGGTADTTTWAYDAATGLLSSKTDAASHAVGYTYNARGQLAVRTWSRSSTTTYGYDSQTAEQLTITYSDGTPNLTYTYNRLGQTATVADFTGTRTFGYDTTTTVLNTETLPSYFDSRVLTSKHDTTGTGTKGRSTGLALSGASGSGTDYDVSYGYDATGRFNSVASSPATFSYAFTTNSNLISGISETSGWSETMTYESNRDLLSNINGQFSSVSKAQFAYAHDALGRRVSVVESGEEFSRYVNSGLVTKYGYNDRSEVTSAQSYHGTTLTDLSYPVAARGFNYAFDNIGSRTSSAVIGTDASDVHTTTYSNNSLNQVTARTPPASTEVTGLAPSGLTVTVNSAAVTRQGDYYYKNVPAGATTPLWQSLAVSNGTTTITRNSFLVATPESYTYDLDGNLTDDGRWHYIWDAENRLASMETSAAAYNVGVPRQLIQFKYDYLGRRVRKTVANYSGSYTAVLDRKFIYNGWNLIAEHDVLTSGNPAVARYLWGLDLSGNLTDGGGVSGLLAIFDVPGSAMHMPSYDANGNIHALVKRSDGIMTAAYEYSPFGETLRATGTYAVTNLFRFSTKYTDGETNLVYFGRRYYNSTLGRWLGRDSAEEKGGLHLYSFVRNNPVSHWDYLGMMDENQLKIRPAKDLFPPDPFDALWAKLTRLPAQAGANYDATQAKLEARANIAPAITTVEGQQQVQGSFHLDGENGTSIILFSKSELDRGGNPQLASDMAEMGTPKYSKTPDGRAVNLSIDVDQVPNGESVDQYIKDKVGGSHFDNVVFSFHGGSDGTADSKVLGLFGPDSSINPTVKNSLTGNGVVVYDLCFGLAPVLGDGAQKMANIYGVNVLTASLGPVLEFPNPGSLVPTTFHPGTTTDLTPNGSYTSDGGYWVVTSPIRRQGD